MNILYFANYFPPTSGAAAICTYKITESFAKRGNKVLILAPADKGKIFKTSKNFIDTPDLQLKSSNSLIKFPFSLIFSHIENTLRFFTKLKKSFKPDLIFSQYHTYHYASVVGGLVSKILKIPHIIRSHDIFIDIKRKTLPFRTFFNINYPRIYRSIRNCDIDYVQTLEMKNYLQKIKIFQKVKFKILHNGIDENQFYPSNNQNVLKDKYGINNIISFIGLMTRDIGLHNFIRVFPDILKTHKDTHLILIGDGPQKSFILNLVKKLDLNKHVHFLGIRPHNEIPFFINNSDIGIARITHQNLWRYFVPVKCLEFMACKKPFITTPISHDVIKNNDVGMILNKDFSDKDLIKKTNLLIDDKNLQVKLGEAGLNKVKKEFNWDILLENLNRDLSHLVQNWP